MPQVYTVLGPISPDSLGITAMHEHLLFGMPGWQYLDQQWSDHAVAFEKIKVALLEFKRLGGQTVVDCGGMATGRDLDFYQALSRTTGVNIVAGTGFREETVIPGRLIPESGDLNSIARPFIRELTEGMVTGLMRKTGIRAGIITAGNSDGRVTRGEENFYRAAARAARQTGAAVTTHGPTMALRQLEILTAEGLDPGRIIIGDCDGCPDTDRDREIARRGAYVAYSRAAYGSPEKDARSLQALKAMVEGGFTRQVLISCDSIGYGLRYPEPPRPLSYLLSALVPALRREGLDAATISTILVDNPKRVLAF